MKTISFFISIVLLVMVGYLVSCDYDAKNPTEINLTGNTDDPPLSCYDIYWQQGGCAERTDPFCIYFIDEDSTPVNPTSGYLYIAGPTYCDDYFYCKVDVNYVKDNGPEVPLNFYPDYNPDKYYVYSVCSNLGNGTKLIHVGPGTPDNGYIIIGEGACNIPIPPGED